VASALAFSGAASAQAVGLASQRAETENAIRVRLREGDDAVRVPRELFAGKLHKAPPTDG